MPYPKRALVLCVLGALALSGVAWAMTVPAHQTAAPSKQTLPEKLSSALTLVYGPEALAGNTYIGSEYCISCHDQTRLRFGRWHQTQHSFMLIRPLVVHSLVPEKGVLADMDQNGVDDFVQGLDFNQVESEYNEYKPNAPRLSVKDGVYTVSIGAVDMPVVFVRQYRKSDGFWIQRYGVRIPVTDSYSGFAQAVYLAGMQYDTNGHKWFKDGIEDMYVGNAPKVVPGMTVAQAMASGPESFDRNCIGCHVTGVRSIAQTAKGEWAWNGWTATLYEDDEPNVLDYNNDGLMELVNAGCESCHGPGSQHVLSGGDPTKILNPEPLGTEFINQVCGQCHSRIKSVPNKTFSWPYNDATLKPWVPGEAPMTDFFVDLNSSTWPDGKTTKGTHMQFNSLYKSSKPTYQYFQVSCANCHNPHRPTFNPAQVQEHIEQGAVEIETRVEDNTLCLACHATYAPFADITYEQAAAYAENVPHIATVTEAHTNHPYGPERMMGLSRCVECHMPKIGKTPGTNDYVVRSHTFEAVSPEKTILYQPQNGMPSSCAVSCHTSLVNSFGLGIVAPLPVNWNAPFDVNLANILLEYYGPGGKWWNTALDGSGAK